MDAQAGHQIGWDRGRGGLGGHDQPAIARGAVAPARSRTRLYIGTAGKEGVFYPLGTAMAAVISKYVSEVDAIAQETNGTAENIRLLQQGKIELALAQPDLAWAASQGQLEGLPRKVAVRNLLGAHARYLHLVTLADRGVKAVEDLKGKRVSTGLAGGATDIKAIRVLGAHGVTPYNLGAREQLDDAEAAQAASRTAGSTPSPSMRRCRVRILRSLTAAGGPAPPHPQRGRGCPHLRETRAVLLSRVDPEGNLSGGGVGYIGGGRDDALRRP